MGLESRTRYSSAEKRDAFENADDLMRKFGLENVLKPPPKISGATPKDVSRFHEFLPLEAYDDTNMEVYAWDQLLQQPEDELDAKVYSLASQHWVACKVISYDAEQAKYSVKISNGGQEQSAPRLFVMFQHEKENPFVLAERIAKAFARRRDAEMLLRYHLYVDCMPSNDVPEIDGSQINRILASAFDIKALRQNALDTTSLLSEVNVDYTRTMNKIIFDMKLQSAPSAGEHALKLPEAAPSGPPPEKERSRFLAQMDSHSHALSKRCEIIASLRSKMLSLL